MAFNRNLKKHFLILNLIIILLVLMSMGVSAATGVFIGSGNVYFANGDINYDIGGYVYYNSNTTTTLDVESLVQWVYNYGVYYVDEMQFYVHDALFVKYTESLGELTSPILTGNNRRVEADWSAVCYRYGVSTSFSKNSSYQYVYTAMWSGYGNYASGGWEVFWYPSSRDETFH